MTYGVPAAPASRPPRPLPHVAASRPRLTLSPPSPPLIRFISLHLRPTVHLIRYLLHRDSLATSGMHPVIEVDGLGSQRRRRRTRSYARDELPRPRNASSWGPLDPPRNPGVKPCIRRIATMYKSKQGMKGSTVARLYSSVTARVFFFF